MPILETNSTPTNFHIRLFSKKGVEWTILYCTMYRPRVRHREPASEQNPDPASLRKTADTAQTRAESIWYPFHTVLVYLCILHWVIVDFALLSFLVFLWRMYNCVVCCTVVLCMYWGLVQGLVYFCGSDPLRWHCQATDIIPHKFAF